MRNIKSRIPPILSLIDADILLWKAAFGTQKNICFDGDTCLPVCSLADAEDALDSILSGILKALKAEDFILCLSDMDNFRKTLCPSYKANRKDKPRPVVLANLRASLTSGTLCAPEQVVTVPGLEADDALGILSTHPVYGKHRRKVIVSIDKDFRCIPGYLYNYKTDQRLYISQAKADHWHMRQTLSGDPVDGYPGCPGIGPKRADQLLDGLTGYAAMWPAVVAAYEKAGLTEADALTQARLARILRYEDYDFTTKEVRLWEVP